jgi:hypothetical protein
MPQPETAPLRPDPERVILRLQGHIGQLTSQLVQLEDVIDQLQAKVQELVAEQAKADNPAPDDADVDPA